ncbi:MAG TPA: hypothetical protein EYP78_05085 [Candidatus Omnitrophica bacterium]|nr:hypothetical protein [Candidatus Omnitrophota bacterium]
MGELLKIFSLKAKTIKNNIVHYRGSKLKLVFITLFVLSFLVGLYALFTEAFNFLNSLPIIGAFLMSRLVFFLLMLSFFILIFSNIIVSYSTIYSGEELQFFFSLPIHHRTVFLQKLTESFIFSSWAFVFVWFPFIISYGRANLTPWYFYLLNLCFFPLFLLICTLLGSIITVVVTTIFSSERWKFYALGLILACIPLFYLFYKILTFSSWRGFGTFGGLEVYLFQLLKHFRLSQHPYLPSFWMSKIFLSLADGRFFTKDNFPFFSLLLSSNLVILSIVLYILVPKFYLKGWLSVQEGRKIKNYPSSKGIVNKLEWVVQFLPAYMRTLFMKDIKNFLRDPKQWSQFLIFFGIMWFYVMNLRSTFYRNLTPYFRIITALLNFSAIGLILSALTTRFMFPLFSLEGKRIWILGLSPIGMKKILLEKFYFTFFLSLILSEPLIFVFMKKLDFSPFLLLIFLGSGFLLSFTLSGLAIGLGAMFPDFQSDNPTKIVSGFGGTLCFILSLGYVVGFCFMLALPFYSYMVERSITLEVFRRLLIFYMFTTTVLSIALGWWSLGGGIKNLRALEI